jgi:hypothetical protein
VQAKMLGAIARTVATTRMVRTVLKTIAKPAIEAGKPRRVTPSRDLSIIE